LRPLLAPIAAVVALQFVGRGLLLWNFPYNYAFDAFQRWAGRDHLLVQAWLPVTQAVIVTTSQLGGGDLAARMALSGVALVGIVSGVVLAARLADRAVAASAGSHAQPAHVVAAWAMVLPASYGPFLVWSGALYQEGTFLAVLFTGLALALGSPRQQRLADVVIGALALVRYEGWPCVLLYLLWRRDPRALVSLWAPALWVTYKLLQPEVHLASPIDYDDWNGLVERTTITSWLTDAARLSWLAFGTGGLWLLGGAGYVAWGELRSGGTAAVQARSPTLLLLAILASQLVATGFWIAGLETATQRMTVIPVMIAGVLAAVAVGRLWTHVRFRPVLVAFSVGFVAVGHGHAWESTREEMVTSKPERVLLRKVGPDCTLVLTPRADLGTRERHDGCEIVQGVSTRLQRQGLWCTAWEAPPADLTGCVVHARWQKGAYVIE
jgi:hypothetical protein